MRNPLSVISGEGFVEKWVEFRVRVEYVCVGE